MWISPVTLEGTRIRLEPLHARHAADLHPWATAETLRFFLSWQPVSDPNDFRIVVEEIAAIRTVLSFAIVLKETNRAVGSTAFMDQRADHRGLEIGTTWIAQPHQGTHVNPESKLLLLTHAFETLGCERVQLKCDSRNVQSAASIRKLGAVQEGTLRKHMICLDGHVRDTTIFSIIRDEWPAVRSGLGARLHHLLGR